MLTSSEVRAFNEEGFHVSRGLLAPEVIKQCWNEIETIFRDQGEKMGLLPGTVGRNDDLILSVMRPDTRERSFVYEFVRHIPAVRGIQTSPVIYELLKDLGLKMPICFQIPTLRFDLPGETRFLTKPHQDVRSIRSARCITIWFPLTPVNDRDGSIAVYPGTHKLGLLKNTIEEKHVKVLIDELPEKASIVDAKPGDVVFMNSLCVHYSHPGSSQSVKVNGQFMYNDALLVKMDDEYDSLKAVPDYRDL